MNIFRKVKSDFANEIFVYECVVIDDNQGVWGVGEQRVFKRNHGKWVISKNYRYVKPTPYEMFNIRRGLKI